MGIFQKIADKATDYGGALTSIGANNDLANSKKGVAAVKYLRQYKKDGAPTGESVTMEDAQAQQGRKTNETGAKKAKQDLEDAKGNLGIKAETAHESLEMYKKTGKAGKY